LVGQRTYTNYQSGRETIEALHRILADDYGELFAEAEAAVKNRILSVLVEEALEELAVPEADALDPGRSAGRQGARREEDTPLPTSPALPFFDVERFVDALAPQIVHDHHVALRIVDALKQPLLNALVDETLRHIYEDVVGTPETLELVLPATESEASADDAAPPHEASASVPSAREEPSGCYVFGIASSEEGITQADVRRLHSPFSDRLHLVPLGSMVAIVGTMETPDDTWAANQQRAIIEHLIDAGYTVLPVREGLVFRDEAQVARTLARHRVVMHKALAYMKDQEEWHVAIRYDRASLLQELRENEQRFEALIESMLLALSKEPASEERLQWYAWRETEAWTQHDAPENLLPTIVLNCKKYSHATLEKLAEDSFVQPSGQEADLVLNAAYLVPRDQRNAFRNALDQLATAYRRLGFAYQSEGPGRPRLFAFRSRLYL